MGMHEALVFLRQAAGDFHHTGAVLPSSRALARALAGSVPATEHPVRVLEIGAGTGVLTRELLKILPAGSQLDIAEINPKFASFVQEKVLSVPAHASARILIGDFLELDLDGSYDAVLSGLPLNNFPPDRVRSILARALDQTRSQGVTAWFEYAYIRWIKSFIVSAQERQRLASVGDALNEALAGQPHQRIFVPLNMPPAFVHRLGPIRRVDKNGDTQ